MSDIFCDNEVFICGCDPDKPPKFRMPSPIPPEIKDSPEFKEFVECAKRQQATIHHDPLDDRNPLIAQVIEDYFKARGEKQKLLIDELKQKPDKQDV